MKLYRSRPHYRSYSTMRPEAVNHLFLEIVNQINNSNFRSFVFVNSRFKKDITRFSYSMSRDHSMDCDYKKATITLSRILYYQHLINGKTPTRMEPNNSTNMSYRYLRLHHYELKLGKFLIRYPHIRQRMRLKIGLVYIYLHKFRRKA